MLTGALAPSAEPRPGQPLALVARLKLDSGWHVYAPDPAAVGIIPLQVTFAGPAGVTFSLTPTYPAPKEESMMGETVKVLDGEIEVRTEAKLPDPLPKPLSFTAKVRYQACSESNCLMPVDLPLSWPASPEAPHGK